MEIPTKAATTGIVAYSTGRLVISAYMRFHIDDDDDDDVGNLVMERLAAAAVAVEVDVRTVHNNNDDRL